MSGTRDAANELARLLAAVRRFRDRPKAGRLPAEIGAQLAILRHAIDQLEIEFAADASEYAATDDSDESGSVSPLHWIRHNCHMSGHAAATAICVGDEVRRLPETLNAVDEGWIGYAHLGLMARTSRALGDSPTGSGTFDEAALLKQAMDHSVSRFRHDCAHTRHENDPAGFLREHQDQVEARTLELSGGEGGMMHLAGWLDSMGGACLRAALEPLARRSDADDGRSRERRLADALVELANHGLDEGLVSQRASQRPHLQVTATLETLRGLAAPAGEVEPSTPIPGATVQRVACDATITRVLLAAESAVVDVGRSQRVVSGATRRALNARDSGCRWPGCDRPPSWSAAHHLIHWAHGGRTDLDNLVLLCHRHHTLVHEGGWQLARGPDRKLAAVPPVGRVTRHHPWARAPA